MYGSNPDTTSVDNDIATARVAMSRLCKLMGEALPATECVPTSYKIDGCVASVDLWNLLRLAEIFDGQDLNELVEVFEGEPHPS